MGGGVNRALGRPSGPTSPPGLSAGFRDAGSPAFQQAFGGMMEANRDSGIARPDPLAALVGEPPKQNKGGFGDVLSTILAVAADATDPEGRGLYTKNLANQWGQRGDAYQKALAAFQGRQQVANLPGMTEREMVAYMNDPKAWGGHMSSAATSRYQAATLNPGDERFLGDGIGSYRAPTRAEQYAQSLDLQPGTESYYNAIRDQELNAQGPTGFQNSIRLEDHKTGNQKMLETARQLGRMQLEGVRQGNRMGLRGAPTYRDLNPPPPRLGGGGRENLPTINTPDEAMKLPPGTKFRTPDGRIKVR